MSGVVFVMDAKDGKLLHEVPMTTDGQEVRSTIAVAHGNLFIRTHNKLYCIGK